MLKARKPQLGTILLLSCLSVRFAGWSRYYTTIFIPSFSPWFV